MILVLLLLNIWGCGGQLLHSKSILKASSLMVRLCDYATVFFSYLHIDFLTFLALLENTFWDGTPCTNKVKFFFNLKSWNYGIQTSVCNKSSFETPLYTVVVELQRKRRRKKGRVWLLFLCMFRDRKKETFEQISWWWMEWIYILLVSSRRNITHNKSSCRKVMTKWRDCIRLSILLCHDWFATNIELHST